MSTKMVNENNLSMSMRSAKKRTKKMPPTQPQRDELQTKYGQAEVLSRPSNSQLADVYKTEEFLNEWSNEVRFHVARNILHLRRYREMSQSSVAVAMGTSQAAIARIESGDENITLDTLKRLVVALNGRVFLSIPPEEHAPKNIRPWWEMNEASADTWTVIGIKAWQDQHVEQAVVGLERRCEGPTSGSTLPRQSGALLLAESTTGA